MTTLDPSTNLPLPPSAIQRVLHITSKVHVYQIPPLNSSQGHKASTWTTNPPIFSPRLRVLETAIPPSHEDGTSTEKVSLAILLEDPSTGELFAAAPYTHPATVAQASDSSRFFAVRVVGEGGMKATLGVGFEERSEAFDFGVALQDAGRTLGFGAGGAAGAQGRVGAGGGKKVDAVVEKPKDYSLKEGQTITVNIGARIHNVKASVNEKPAADPAAPVPFLPPPPSAADVKSAKHGSGDVSNIVAQKPASNAAELGFDDGEFGEFQ